MSEATNDPQTGSHPRPSPIEVARAARKRRAQRLLRNLLIWVGLPSVAGIVYFGLLARSQYESFATLSIPGAHAPLVREFMLSRDMLAKLEAQSHFSQHYQQADDLISGLSADAGSEERYSGFLGKVDVRVEQSGLLRLKVRAFSGSEAQRFARQVTAEVAAFLVAQQLEPGAKLVVVSRPSLATQPTYPRRFYGMLTVLFVSAALFAIGSLLVAAAREHAQF